MMTIPRRALFGKLDITLFGAVESATAFARLRGNPHVELSHWLHQILQLDDSDLHRICRHSGVDRRVLERDLNAALALLPAGATSISDFSCHLEAAIERAWVLASLQHGDRRIRGAWLVAALLQTPDLKRLVCSFSAQFERLVPACAPDVLAAIIQDSPEASAGLCNASSESLPSSCDLEARPQQAGAAGAALDRFGEDLTARARRGHVDPVIGRDFEIRSLVDILLRRRQNNPLLVGEAGVGKSAVVEGLAQAIARGDVPPALCRARLVTVDLGGLLAGAGQRGEFESRLKDLLAEATRSPDPVILFIDEVHGLVGAGGASGTGDAANLLKPALARGGLRVVGATTWGEYKRHIEKDPALTRRFQVLRVPEPEPAVAVDMVRGLASTFAAHHGVALLDDAVRACVVLSQRYLPDRQLPDKAISLLDTACARVGLSLHAPSAQVLHARTRVAGLESERALLVDAAMVGHAAEARAQRLRELEPELAMAGRATRDLEATWERERVLVQRLLAARAAGRASPVEAANASPGCHAELRTIESELQALQGETPRVHPQVDEHVVAAVVADWTGIPVGRMVTDDAKAVAVLQETLATRIVGQADALDTIVRRIQTARAGLGDPARPVGAFLLAGPSGVGKTETASALAEAMYGGERNLIVLNMSEFQEAHTVSTLKGAPPGYVGYGEGGVLTEAVRRKPYSVVLLDEIEKAHPDVHRLFYQVFDKGTMEDGEGRAVDFRHATLLLTCNAGAEAIEAACRRAGRLAPHAQNPQNLQSLQSLQNLRLALMPALHDIFPTALLARLTIVPYRSLDAAALNGIVQRHLDRVGRRLDEQHGIALHCTADLVAHFVGRGETDGCGARQAIAAIEHDLLPELSRMWLVARESRRTLRAIRADLRPAADRGAGAAAPIVCEPVYA